jgi:hypothetical protein
MKRHPPFVGKDGRSAGDRVNSALYMLFAEIAEAVSGAKEWSVFIVCVVSPCFRHPTLTLIGTRSERPPEKEKETRSLREKALSEVEGTKKLRGMGTVAIRRRCCPLLNLLPSLNPATISLKDGWRWMF